MPTSVRGVLPFDGSVDQALQVRLQQLVLDTSERRLDPAGLCEHLHGRPLLFDHPRDAANLPFDAVQPVQEFGLGVWSKASLR